jgi:serpin B
VGALQQLGVTHAFDPALADFTGMAEPRPTGARWWWANILHQAFLRVDESGTEAAAATAVVAMVRRPLPQRQSAHLRLPSADEPFLFALRDRQSG